MDRMMDALVFDLDDSLVVDEASAAAAFLDACRVAESAAGILPDQLFSTIKRVCREIWHRSPARKYCIEIGISSWEGLWADFQGADENISLLRAWAPEYRKNSWHSALRQHGVGDEALALKLVDTYIEARRARHVDYDDVVPCLEEFKGKCRLGLLTNGDPWLQRRKIEGAGIRSYFDVIVVSGEEGIGKPDARIFRTMLSRLGVTPAESAMIGNSLKDDIRGAQQVGMKAVWINRGGKVNDKFIRPDLVISTLWELKTEFCLNQRPSSTPE
jgi:putative hydrolase of the HAD superfamily